MWVLTEYCEGGELLELLKLAQCSSLSEDQIAMVCWTILKVTVVKQLPILFQKSSHQ